MIDPWKEYFVTSYLDHSRKLNFLMTTKQRPIINNRSISVLVFSVYKACYYQKCYSNNHIRPGQGLIENKKSNNNVSISQWWLFLSMWTIIRMVLFVHRFKTTSHSSFHGWCWMWMIIDCHLVIFFSRYSRSTLARNILPQQIF